MRRGRVVVITGSVVLAGIAVGVAAGWWFVHSRERRDPMDGRWTPVVTTIAGRGVPGDRDAAATLAEFSDPYAVAVAPDGRVYVADAGEANRIRRIGPDGVVTLAGGSGEGHRDGRRGLAAFHTPSGLALATDGALYVADTGTHTIRRVSMDGNVTTVAGTGTQGYADGIAASATFDGPMGLAIAPDGRLLVADAYNHRIRAIDPAGTVTTLAGSGTPGSADGNAADAQFDTPCGVAVTPDGVVYVADTGNGLVRRIDGSGIVSTLALVPDEPFGDTSLLRPIGIASGHDGRLAVSDRRGRVLQVMPNGSARLLAGSVTGYRDGGGASARFNGPAGVAVDARGAIVVADAGNYLVRRIAAPGLYDPDPPRSPLAPPPGFPTPLLRQHVLAWPIDPQFGWHEVAGTMGEARGTAMNGRERFHAGFDVQAAPGTIVRAVRGAKVDAPIAALNFGDINESVTIGPFTYVHVRAGRDARDASLEPGRFDVLPPDAIRSRGRLILRRGSRVALGDPIGTVNRFAHVHLNAGAPGREVNPLSLPLAGFVDTVPPTIERKGVTLYDDQWTRQALTYKGRTVVRGRIRIVVDAWDQVDGNEPRRRLGLYRLSYQVLGPDRSPLREYVHPRTTVIFDRLPQDPGAAGLIYADGTGISVYGHGRTRFRYVATTRVVDGEATDEPWDTTTLAPGPYTLVVTAADVAGNEARREVPVWVYR